MNSAMRAVSVAVLGAAIATSLSACGPTTSTKSTTASSTPSKSAGPLDGLSGGEIAQKAMVNLKQASTFHYAGTGKSSGMTIAMDITVVSGKGCEGSLTEGKGSVMVTMIDTTVWAKADRAFWIANGISDPAVLSMVADKWIRTTKSGNLGSSMSNLCNLNKMLDPKVVGGTTRLQKGSTSTVDGQPALQLKDTAGSGTIEVSNTAEPRLLSATDPSPTDGGTFAFTDYNAPVNLTPPPASETIDGKKYGL